MTSSCAASGCGGAVKARAMCSMHYQRWVKLAQIAGDIPPMRRWTLDECRVDEAIARVPLCNQSREVVAWTLIDVADWPVAAERRWQLHTTGYATATARPAGRLYLHRVLLQVPRGVEVDHVNRDRLDNRRANLRLASRALNAQNLPGYGKYSPHRGVTWDKRGRRWIAQVWLDGSNHYLGRFDDENEAAAVAAEFRARHMPFATS